MLIKRPLALRHRLMGRGGIGKLSKHITVEVRAWIRDYMPQKLWTSFLIRAKETRPLLHRNRLRKNVGHPRCYYYCTCEANRISQSWGRTSPSALWQQIGLSYNYNTFDFTPWILVFYVGAQSESRFTCYSHCHCYVTWCLYNDGNWRLTRPFSKDAEPVFR